jgi:hypothetical protein
MMDLVNKQLYYREKILPKKVIDLISITNNLVTKKAAPIRRAPVPLIHCTVAN